MTQNCPLCGKPVHVARYNNTGNLAGRYYFCRGTPESCRATFRITRGDEFPGIV